MKSTLKEFKEFATHGNFIDLAIGLTVGTGFSKIVTSLVNDIILPPIGLLLGNVDFSNLYINLSERHFESLSAAKAAGVATINYGAFINTLVDFLIVAFVIFVLIKQINRLKREEPKISNSKPCPFCLSDIPLKATKCSHCTSEIHQES
jgi:large conductance mechanosensitive channel